MRILQIVPTLPPPSEGVGSYALALARMLEARWELRTSFLVGDPSWRSGAESGPFTAAPVPARRPEALTDALESAGDGTAVLVHYANYGYQRRGCPAWLVEGLARWRSRGPQRRLVTAFHEVYASGPPWHSSFWLSPRQRRLAATLAHLSGALVTSLERYREMIQPWSEGREIRVLPVFSTVGEPEKVRPVGERARRIVVFGSAGVRRRAYERFLPDLAMTACELEAEEIWDIGPAVPHPATAGSVPILHLGVLPAEKVSKILQDSAAGFLAYPPAFLPKSTIFAAYCSHGALPVCSWDRHLRDGAPVAGRHYWAGSGDPQAIASAARDWYAGHSLTGQAETFRRLLECTGIRA
ncbi:MAG TPA: glycosyltransferase family 1 protein [Thermoanaerobaculia bacterium]|nr:glycosyltransferase family 1 protein [Thermoanaerobaculia bacterium]